MDESGGDHLQGFPQALTPAAQHELDRFLAAYEANAKEVNAVSLSILVWGQAPAKDSKIARKRRDIRNGLIRQGHNAMFSEDLPAPNREGLSEASKEFAQLRAAHLAIILIEDSPGALAEAHDFCSDPTLADKLTVMVPRKYESGYSSRGALRDLELGFGGVYWYDEDAIDKCDVLTWALRRAEARRQLVFRRGYRSD